MTSRRSAICRSAIRCSVICRSVIRRATAVVAAGAAALVLAACGSDDTSTSGHDMGSMNSSPSATASAGQGSHNAQDVAFAQGMIPHHRQALAMAGLAADRAGSPDVRKLASVISKAQEPEITTMSGWLTSWGEKVPADSAQGGDHSGGHDMNGMMSSQDMADLEALSGAAFDTAFLDMMIAHHQGAVAMARTEQAKGAYAPAKDLATSVIASQSAEITEMNEMLGRN
ncbi:DUF305 domain-containing protein [Streptomyces sp. NPDC056796]|uniref:DUF305 domain-containing protein n=1 Tax=Streptomyces sp. NPDC056796 TaxID=3345947 RepID=UPI0036CF5F8E